MARDFWRQLAERMGAILQLVAKQISSSNFPSTCAVNSARSLARRAVASSPRAKYSGWGRQVGLLVQCIRTRAVHPACQENHATRWRGGATAAIMCPVFPCPAAARCCLSVNPMFGFRMKSSHTSTSYWEKALLWSLPASLAIQFLLPVVNALFFEPRKGIICTASLHGARSVPCDLPQLLIEWLEYIPISNLLFLGIPTLAC